MATNNGFSAAAEIFGTIAGLTAKESSEGMGGSVAEATNEFGDTVAHDEFAQRMSPSVTYAVSGTSGSDTINLSSFPKLGHIVSYSTKKIMVTQVQITTTAGQPPSVTISGIEVHSTATDKRTYDISGSLLARCKAQDVASAFSAPTSPAAFNSVTTTFSVDAVTATKGGDILAACATHGRVEVNATVTDPNGTATLAAVQGFTITSPASKTAPDESYVSLTATATKCLTGSEGGNGGGGASA